jgi:TRAP-type transport system periplasmic protein
MQRISPFIFLAAAFAAVLAAGCDTDRERTQWHFALEHREGSVQHAYAERFAELLEQRTGGRVGIVIHPAPSLGPPMDVIYLAQNGSVQLAFASSGVLGRVVPEAQVFLLHETFSANAQINHQLVSMAGDARAALESAYRDRGLHPVSMITDGWVAWLADRPLDHPEDFIGIRIRTPPAQLVQAEYRGYGARPIAMPEQEAYGALQLDLVDAHTDTVAQLEQMRTNDQDVYLTLPRRIMRVTSIITPSAFFDLLSDDLRSAIVEVTAELADEAYWLQREANEAHLAALRQRDGLTVIELDDDARRAFADANAHLIELYVQDAGERGQTILDLLTQTRHMLESGSRERASGRPRPQLPIEPAANH